MKILVTGAKGFLGKNLVADLRASGYDEIYEYDLDTKKILLDNYCRSCDFVFHLAGVNRPKNEDEFMKGNFGFTSELLETLKKYDNKAPIVLTSSIQALRDNPYGLSKKAGEDLLFEYGEKNNSKVYIYRLNNLFGKWSKPNYNTVVATFCYNISRDLEIRVDNPEALLTLNYVDDVVNEFKNALVSNPSRDGKFCIVNNAFEVKLGRIVELLETFKESRKTLQVPNMCNAFEKDLYSTYLSFLPSDQFAYDLKMNVDNRGSFTEVLRTPERGQVSINISKPNITKGNHWHHTKNEKFLVVSGKGVIRFRNPYEETIIEYKVSGDHLRVVDIPTGYTHSIVNTGDKDMVTLMWVNECFNPEKPDTYYLGV